MESYFDLTYIARHRSAATSKGITL